MIKLSASIMHCSWNKERVVFLKDILKKIDTSLLCSFKISDDLNKEGIWSNYKKAQMMYGKEATHHVVLQDDFMPCNNFIPALLKLISLYPNDIINFFSATNVHKLAYKNNVNVFKAVGGTWGGSVIMPISHINWIDEADYFFSQNSKLGVNCDDDRLNLLLQLQNKNVIHITPSLTQHIGENSLIGNVSGRVSEIFIEDQDPMMINWDADTVPEYGFIWRRNVKYIYDHIDSDKKQEFLDRYGNGTFKNYINKYKEINRCNK